MKKIVSLVLALMLIMSCAALADYDGTAPVFEEPVTVSILSCNGASKRADVADMLWWQMVLKNANVDLKMEIIDDSTYKDVAEPRLAAAQDLPDIVKISGNETLLAQSGVFMPLNDLIEEYGYNLSKMFEKYPGVKEALTMNDGNIYYLPYFYTTESNSRTLMVNTQFLAALDMTLDDIKTVEDWYNYLVLVKENDVNGNGDPDDEIPLFMRSGMIDLIAMYWGLDVTNTSGFPIKDGQVFCAYITDEYREFLEFVNQLYTEGLLYNEFLSANYDMQTAAFNANTVGSIVHFVSNCTDYSMDINPNWDFFNDDPIMQIVALEDLEGNPVVYGRGVIGSKYGISSNCKDPAAAMQLCDYMYSEEVGLLTWYGVEGVDYVKNEDGTYSFNKIYYDGSYLGDCGYNCDFMPGYQYDYSAKQCYKIYQQTQAAAPYTWNPTRLSKYYTDAQQEVLTTYRTDLETYFKENTTAFMIGTKSFDEWDAFVEGAYEMHVQDIIDVYQEAEG